ncbi:MAG: DUF5131 family protein [Opitutales bacterium]|nr:DUF5131 family protein [Opitutales bacterium]
MAKEIDLWNPWHGCRKISEGCLNCYVYRIDSSFGKNPEIVEKTKDFFLPLKRNKSGSLKIPPLARVYTCLSSDFFLEDADPWRAQAWQIIKARPDLHFCIITKRIHRFYEKLPADWADGYENVTIISTCENQKRADFRLPILLDAPIKNREITCEPLLENLDIKKYLKTGKIKRVIAGGESGPNARICRHEWVESLRRQCVEANVPFSFKQTGARYFYGGKIYSIPRNKQHSQAAKSGMDFEAE